MVLCVCLEMGGSLAWSSFLYSYVFILLAVFRKSHLFSQIFDTVSVITNLYMPFTQAIFDPQAQITLFKRH